MTFKKKTLSSLVLLFASACLSAEPSSVAEYQTAVEGPQHPDRNGLDALTIEQLMQRLHVPGVAVAVIKDFQIHWSKAYGIADVETGVAVDGNTLFQAASISKPISAMAMVKFAGDGKFPLDDDINSILRSWRLPESPLTKERRVTARMLASHSAGLGDGFGFPGYNPGAPLPTVIQIINGQSPSNVGPVLMARPPLQAMHYSGGGFTILQLALTDAVGRPFPEILRDTVLGPIGMTNSVFEQPLSPARDRNAARGHDDEGKSMGAKWHVYPEYAAAGLWTTPVDLARFVIEVQKSVHGQSNRVLSRTATQEMLNPVGVGDFAVGLSMEKRGQGWYFKHSGGNWGFICFMIGHKLNGYGLAVMTNSFNGQPLINEIQQRVERAYGWDSLDKPVWR
ncbi:MAG TPA: serine hydrolase domain-containing protein [Steroidobacter sp.]